MRHIARITLIALALALLGLALTPTASPAQGSDSCGVGRIPYSWTLHPAQPCAGDSVTLVFHTCSCRDCVQLLGVDRPSEGPLILNVRLPGVCPATLACCPDSAAVPLGRLAAGDVRIKVQVRAQVMAGDSIPCITTRDGEVAFTVCGGPSPPSDSLLPFVSRIVIGATPPCIECPRLVCPGMSIPLIVAGTFPNTCYRFEKLELLPSMIVGPRAEPPIVRIVVGVNDCLGMTCADWIAPWSAETLLPALPPGIYRLPLQLQLVRECDSAKVDTTYYATRSFTVRDSCPVLPVQLCFYPGWDHSGANGACDAFVGTGAPARVGMTILTGLPLAGLQGTLSLFPTGLRISDLVPAGPAKGMHLSWQPTADGAKFVMFAEQGAPIGAGDSTVHCPWPGACSPPIALEVSLLPAAGAVPPPITHLAAHDLLGSDSLGNKVPECQIATLVVVESRICAGPSCDFNQDGHLDVRDLVTMVHCILGTGQCPDTSLASLGCNGDGRLGVDDVLCCARTILHGGERDTVRGRREPGVAVALGQPAGSARGLDVPLTLTGADHVGAVRLAFNLPADRYDISAVDLGASASQWLEVHEVVDGRLVVGLIGLGAQAGAQSAALTDVSLTLRLAVRAGQVAGGELSLADAQFAGPDGATLDVTLSPISATLPGAGGPGLAAARPNPFTGETRLALDLDRGADADVAVYDLGGRRVTTLWHGALAAGPHEFAWRGERSDGSRAGAGVYFVQARVSGQKLGRKVVFLRGN